MAGKAAASRAHSKKGGGFSLRNKTQRIHVLQYLCLYVLLCSILSHRRGGGWGKARAKPAVHGPARWRSRPNPCPDRRPRPRRRSAARARVRPTARSRDAAPAPRGPPRNPATRIAPAQKIGDGFPTARRAHSGVKRAMTSAERFAGAREQLVRDRLQVAAKQDFRIAPLDARAAGQQAFAVGIGTSRPWGRASVSCLHEQRATPARHRPACCRCRGR